MKVIYLDLNQKKPKLQYAIWTRGKVVEVLEDIHTTYRLFKPEGTTSTSFTAWTLNAKHLDADTLIVSNDTLHDVEFTYNGRRYKVPYRDITVIPTEIVLSEDFKNHCQSVGLFTLQEFEKEYCRVHRLCIDTGVDAFKEILACQGGSYI